METFIRLIMENFTITFLVTGLIASGISLLRRPMPLSASIILEALFSYFLLFSVGISFFYNFVLHVFFGDMTAAFIGWQPSPFQTEVGMASLGFSIVGFLSFKGGFGLRLGAVTGPSIFLLGAAGGHLYQMIVAGNFSPGNAGVIFFTDILIPVIAMTFIWLQHRYDKVQIKM